MSPAVSTALATRGLTKRYKDRTVVDDLDLRVPEGGVFGFLGRNGTDQFLHLFVSSSIKSTDQFRAWIFMSSSRSSRAAASVRRRRSGTSTTRTVLISLRP